MAVTQGRERERVKVVHPLARPDSCFSPEPWFGSEIFARPTLVRRRFRRPASVPSLKNNGGREINYGSRNTSLMARRDFQKNSFRFAPFHLRKRKRFSFGEDEFPRTEEDTSGTRPSEFHRRQMAESPRKPGHLIR